MWEIITLLFSLGFLVLAGFSEDKEVRIFCILTCVCNAVLHFVPDSQGLFAYAGAGFNDLIIILLISKFTNRGSLAESLQWLSLIFIFINLYGWIIWMKYFPPTSYSILAIVAYVIALALIFTKGKFKDVRVLIRDIKVGYNRLGDWCFKLFSINIASNSKLFRNQTKKEKT